MTLTSKEGQVEKIASVESVTLTIYGIETSVP